MTFVPLLRLLPQAGLLLAGLLALLWIDHGGYRRAMADRDARDARLLDAVRSELRRTEQRLANAIAAEDGRYRRQADAIAAARNTLQPIVMKETDHAPRLADAGSGLTPGLLAAVNAARATGACAAAASGRLVCALPAAPASR